MAGMAKSDQELALLFRRERDEGRPPSSALKPHASKFVLGIGTVFDHKAVTEAVDRALLAQLGTVIDKPLSLTDRLHRTLEYAERFCLAVLRRLPGMVKERAYGSRRRSRRMRPCRPGRR